MKSFFNCRRFLVIIAVIVLIGSFSQKANSQVLEVTDTLTLPEITLDTVKFYLFEDVTRLENTVRDTIVMLIDGKLVKIPYKVTGNTIIDYRQNNQAFRLTGVSLYDNQEFETYLKDIFRQPREKLKDKISPKDWTYSEIYLRYFEPFDKNSPYRGGNQVSTDYDVDELEDNDIAIQNYETFPIPETIDIEVDLKKNPRVVRILGLEFDFDKLDPKFQRMLLGYGGLKSGSYRKSTLQ